MKSFNGPVTGRLFPSFGFMVDENLAEVQVFPGVALHENVSPLLRFGTYEVVPVIMVGQILCTVVAIEFSRRFAHKNFEVFRAFTCYCMNTVFFRL